MLPRSPDNQALTKAGGGSRFTLTSNKLSFSTFVAHVPLFRLIQHSAVISQLVARASLHHFPLCSPVITFILRISERQEGKRAAVRCAEAADRAALLGLDMPVRAVLLCVPVVASLESGLKLGGGWGSFALQRSAAGPGSISRCCPCAVLSGPADPGL